MSRKPYKTMLSIYVCMLKKNLLQRLMRGFGKTLYPKLLQQHLFEQRQQVLQRVSDLEADKPILDLDQSLR